MARRPTMQEARIEIRGAMTRHAAEALSLEIRRLARQHGIDVTQVRVERPEEERLP